MSRRTLIRFGHGLGDAVQLTLVLQHLKHYDPGGEVHVTAGRGKHSLFHHIADYSFVSDDEEPRHDTYDRVVALEWHDAPECYHDSPSTKPYRCIREVFHLRPVAFRYRINVTAPARRRVEHFVTSMNGPYALIHYQGNTLSTDKDLSHDEMTDVCHHLIRRGLVPIILDWDQRSPLPDGRTIICPDVNNPLWLGYNTGDGESLAALVESAKCFIGIDSGPLHVAMATRTPTIAVWVRHHPLHYADLADNTLHLVPDDHATYLRGNRDAGMAFFEQHYTYRAYAPRSLALSHALTDAIDMYT